MKHYYLWKYNWDDCLYTPNINLAILVKLTSNTLLRALADPKTYTIALINNWNVFEINCYGKIK